tara:strand:- start:8464 stop:11478 length:3015 start_codon:yes stop_codon:yes gene_type:complete
MHKMSLKKSREELKKLSDLDLIKRKNLANYHSTFANLSREMSLMLIEDEMLDRNIDVNVIHPTMYSVLSYSKHSMDELESTLDFYQDLLKKNEKGKKQSIYEKRIEIVLLAIAEKDKIEYEIISNTTSDNPSINKIYKKIDLLLYQLKTYYSMPLGTMRGLMYKALKGIKEDLIIIDAKHVKVEEFVLPPSFIKLSSQLKDIDNVDMKKYLTDSYNEVKKLLSELIDMENKSFKVFKDNKQIFQGDKDFVKFCDMTIRDMNPKLYLSCNPNRNVLLAYQTTVGLTVGPSSSCQRLLAIHRTGAGKTQTMLKVLDNYFYDIRPKIVCLPDRNLIDNFIGKTGMVSNTNNTNKYVQFLKNHVLPEDIFKVYSMDKVGKKYELNFDNDGIKDRLQFKGNLQQLNEENEQYGFIPKFALKRTFSEFVKDFKAHPRFKETKQTTLIDKITTTQYKDVLDWFDYSKVVFPNAPLKCFLFSEIGGSGFKGSDNLDPVAKRPRAAITKKDFQDSDDYNISFNEKGVQIQESNMYNSKIIIFDEFHKLLNYKKEFQKGSAEINPDTLKNVENFIEKLRKTNHTTNVIAFTATPGDSATEIRRTLSVVKGNCNSKKTNEGFVSYWMSSPESLYPELEGGDAHSQKVQLLNYTTIIKNKKKINRINGIHPYELDYDKKSFLTTGSAAYYITQHEEYEQDIDKFFSGDKSAKDKNLSKVKLLQALCNIPVKSLHHSSLSSVKDKIQTLNSKQLEIILPKFSAIVKLCAKKETGKCLVLIQKECGLDILSHMLSKYLKECSAVRDCTGSGDCHVVLVDDVNGKDKNNELAKERLDEFNHPCNARGEKIKVACANVRNFGTGVSFFGIRTIIIVNPPTSYSEYEQFIGRAFRTCNSHHLYGSPKFTKSERKVKVIMYIASHPDPDIATIDEMNAEQILRERDIKNHLHMNELRINSIDDKILSELSGDTADNDSDINYLTISEKIKNLETFLNDESVINENLRDKYELEYNKIKRLKR